MSTNNPSRKSAVLDFSVKPSLGKIQEPLTLCKTAQSGRG